MEDTIVNGFYHYKGIFTGICEGEFEISKTELLLMKAKNIIDAILNNCLFEHIMNSKFSDLEIVSNVLENIGDDMYTKYNIQSDLLKVIKCNPNGIIDTIHVEELTIKFIYDQQYVFTQVSLCGKSVMYTWFDNSENWSRAIYHHDIIGHKLAPTATKSARN